MNRPYVVALEGLPGAGKTTLKNTLTLGEASIDRVEQILPGDPQSDADISLEAIIASDLLKTTRATAGEFDVVILDRYYLSTLAYQYAYDRMTGQHTHPPLRTRYDACLQDGRLITPDATFYIDTPLDASYSRKGRIDDGTPWTDRKFLTLSRQYYRRQTGLITVDGSDGIERVQSEIEMIIMENLHP